MREVLIRLSFEMLAVKHPSRGFSVPSLTLAEIEDLTTVRIHNDTFALRMAIMRGGLEWESRIIATHHVLSRTPRRTADDPQHTNEDWARAHAAFHHGPAHPEELHGGDTMGDILHLNTTRH